MILNCGVKTIDILLSLLLIYPIQPSQFQNTCPYNEYWIPLSLFEDTISGDNHNHQEEASDLVPHIDQTKLVQLASYNEYYSNDNKLASSGISPKKYQAASVKDPSTGSFIEHQLEFRTEIVGGRPVYIYDCAKLAVSACIKGSSKVDVEFFPDRIIILYQWTDGSTSKLTYQVDNPCKSHQHRFR